MTDSDLVVLVVGLVEGHPLVHLRVAGGDQTICGRPATVDWPTKTFRSAGCLGCLGAAIESGRDVALDSDGMRFHLRRLWE
jgi:hypothetical protein